MLPQVLMSTDIFRELDEDLRQQKLEQIWKAHGRKIITGAVALILATGAYTLWADRKASTLEASTGQLTTILQQIKPETHSATVAELEKLAATAPTGQAIIARLYAAAVAADGGDTQDAVRQLDALSADKSAPALYRDYATVLSAYHQLDTADPVQLQNKLSPLKGDKKPWRYAAEELSALLSLKQGDKDSAKAALERLQAATDAPQGVRERATRILATFNTGS